MRKYILSAFFAIIAFGIGFGALWGFLNGADRGINWNDPFDIYCIVCIGVVFLISLGALGLTVYDKRKSPSIDETT